MNEANDFIRLLEQHRFHHTLIPRVCTLCRVEEFRSTNTPTLRWVRATRTFLTPPYPIAIMAGMIVVLITALAFTI